MMPDTPAIVGTKGLRLKLDAAAIAVLQSGRSWGEGPYTFPQPDYFDPRPLWEPVVHSIECKGGAVPHDWLPPSGWRMVRYADWFAAGRPGATEGVFVFGSNLAGRHGRGAALHARQVRGAEYGCGRGMTGDAYALPTKGFGLEVLPLWTIAEAVDEFLQFVRRYPAVVFQLTPVGCGLAGYKREQIEPLFAGAPPNVRWPREWLA